MSSSLFDRIHHVVSAAHIRQYARSTSTSQEEELRLAVTQYKPRDEGQSAPPKDAVTVLVAHSSGFPKELYEPMFDALLFRLHNQSHVRICGIWVADVANQGESGLLNSDKLGNEVSWFDHARDYLVIVNHFRKEMPRPIIGIGHSMGSTVLINLALLHARLLTTVIAIEPMINTSAHNMNFAGVLPLTNRRDHWKNRQDAMVQFKKNPLFKNFDQRVLELFEQYGLREKPDGTITLTTAKDQEVITFARSVFPPSRELRPQDHQPSRLDYPDLGVGHERNPSNVYYRPESTLTFQWLPFLRPSCFYIYGKTSPFDAMTPVSRKDKLKTTGIGANGSGGAEEGRVKDIVFDGGHFLPFESPDAVANLVSSWIVEEMTRWAADEQKEADSWQEVSHHERSKLTGDWKFWANKMYGKPTSGKQRSRL